MKNIYKIFVLFIFTMGLTSCDPNENFEILPAVESFQIITPTSGSVVVLNDTNLTNNALFISWSVLEGSVGSTFNIEIAETGTDFANPTLLGTSEGANFSMTVEELNTFFLDTMGINPDEATSMDIRVLNSTETTQTIAVVFTPYTVEYTELFLVGSITDPQWSPEDALPMTRLDFNKFEITLDLIDGDEFKFLPTNTGWDGDIGEDPDNPGFLIDDGEANLSGYSAGKYTITVDLNTFTFEIEEILPPSSMYMVGNGVPSAGWGWDSPIVMTQIQDGVFQATTSFANDAFRFFTVEGDWGSGLNYPYYLNAGYTIDTNFEDALDGDNNFKFIGTPGEYTITLDNINKTIVLSQIPLHIAVPGKHQGWDPGTAPLLAASVLGETDYEGFVWLTIEGDEGFKFMAPNADGNFEWGNTDWGDNGSFTGILVESDEVNCKVESDGYYLVKADTQSLTYSTELTNWGVIGNATPTGWDSDTDMVYDSATKLLTLSLDLVEGELKFRANDDWVIDLGDTRADGELEFGGDNIVVSEAGTYTITLDLNTPRGYAYSLVKN